MNHEEKIFYLCQNSKSSLESLKINRVIFERVKEKKNQKAIYKICKIKIISAYLTQIYIYI